MRPGERADLSLTVHPYREAPCCYGSAPYCPHLPRHADAGQCASEPGGGKAGERRERASSQSDRCARVARRQSEQGRGSNMASVATRIPESVAHLDLATV